MNQKIVLASDHAGFKLKEEVKRYLVLKGYEVIDLGPDNDETPISYAKQGIKIGKEISKSKNKKMGIAFCGTGLGMSFAVNRVKGVRGARITSIADAKMAKKHNNSNILVMGGRITTTKKAVDMFNAFVREDFESGRHNQRIADLDKF